jgi:hypothetical protein
MVRDRREYAFNPPKIRFQIYKAMPPISETERDDGKPGPHDRVPHQAKPVGAEPRAMRSPTPPLSRPTTMDWLMRDGGAAGGPVIRDRGES